MSSELDIIIPIVVSFGIGFFGLYKMLSYEKLLLEKESLELQNQLLRKQVRNLQETLDSYEKAYPPLHQTFEYQYNFSLDIFGFLNSEFQTFCLEYLSFVIL